MKYIKNLLMFTMIIMLLGCSEFEISNEIYPKLTIVGRDIGVVYKLGNLTISDTWEKVDKDKLKYIKENIEKQDGFANLTFTLYIRYDEVNSDAPYFYYYINGIAFKESHLIPTVSGKLLIAHMDSIEGFHLYKLNGNEVNEKNDEVIQKEIAKVKKEVKKEIEEDQGNRYKEPDDKW